MEKAEEYARDIDPSLLGPLPFELAVERYSAVMRQIVKAEVQELGTYSAIEKDDKHELVAKLSRGTYEAYKVPFNAISSEKDASAMQYKQFLELKNVTWEALANVYGGVYFNHDQRNGEALALVRHAKKSVQQVEKVCTQYQKNNKSQKDVAKEQHDFLVYCCNRFDEKFGKENSMVYHHKIPDQVPDLPLPAQTIGKPTPFEFPKAHELWTGDVYASFNLADVALVGNEQVPVNMPRMEPTTQQVAINPVEEKETKKREREEDDMEENRKKSTRYDSGGVSLCIIL
jgi:hypothetical protein